MLQDSKRQPSVRLLQGKLLTSYEYLLEQDDASSAGKVKQLADKLAKQEFAVAFCGHFSAGKSTIINRLIGEELLPSSPIPTSANLVKVRAGEEYAKVIFKSEKPRLYLAPYDYELVKKYCKDGDQIQEIEISHAQSSLPEHTVILDTPGIDSADDAHRIATESAIHLADLIFYVMDYNHVQSELNFMFTKELTEAGKEVYLVINQVDKHSEQELSFADFQRSVSESFAAWGVTPAAVFYTSLKEAAHPHNQFQQLQGFLTDRLQQKDELLLHSIRHSLQKILDDHCSEQERRTANELQPCRELLSELPPAKQAELAESHNQIQQEQSELKDGAEAAESEFDGGIEKIMSSAYLMRFETRALAEAYLEAAQSSFKVGWLFSAQKTAAERDKRLQCFYQDLLEKTKSQLEWHLRDFLLRFVKERRLETAERLERIQQFSVDFSSELLTGAVKDGAKVSGTTVINYTDSVATEIKRLAKSAAQAYKAELLQAIDERTAALTKRLAEQSAGLERYLAALTQLAQREIAMRAKRQALTARLDAASGEEEDRYALFAQREAECEIIAGLTAKPEERTPLTPSRPLQQAQQPPAQAQPQPVEATKRLQQLAGKLQQTAGLVEELPGFRKLAAELQDKAARLNNKGFTVALFGAFSAGKSSFANALIGERALPVSPNPTTAAINKIKPVTPEQPHGSVRIKLKEERAMLEDVNHALKLFDCQAATLAEAKVQAAGLDGSLGQQGAAEKTTLSFLQAFVRGYPVLGAALGGVVDATMDEFSDYVALEEKSCFVEWAELYYDCPLTRKGITLVDTPGADSINVRHTGVAFDFIKNSDAILFVTYYNHAFSKADREFLMQLGRVKDSFQLDKMFFVINAIDLAANDEEQATVVDYVQEQLIKYGVRNPHLYPLSSLQALQEKLEPAAAPGRSGMAQFEDAFQHFIAHDLANLAMAASENELQRIAQRIAKLIESSREDVAVKMKRRANIEAEKTALQDILARQSAANCEQRLQQETQVLLYYIKQRVFLRFNDFFRDAFNPSVLRDDGRNLKKTLQHALDELLQDLGFEFAQELRATTVRLDRFGEKIIAQQQEALVDQLTTVNEELSFSQFEYRAQAQLEFDAAFVDLPRAAFADALAYFKNPKAFFEKQESKRMNEELQRILGAAADEYLAREQRRLDNDYKQSIARSFGELIAQMADQTNEYYLSLLAALDGGVPVERLLEIQRRLTEPTA